MGNESSVEPSGDRKEGTDADTDKDKGKGKGKDKGKKTLEGYASEQLTPEGNLGKGMFSEVFRGSFKTTSGPMKVAIKPELADLELHILEKIAGCQPSPKGVVPVLDAAHRTSNGPVALLQLGTLGTLEDALPRLVRAGIFGDETFLAVVAGIAEGLASLHELEIIHCDPKPGNLVLHSDSSTSEVVIWLIDFGDARALDDPDSWWAAGHGDPVLTCHADMGHHGHLSTQTDSWCLAQCAALIWSYKSGSWSNPSNPAWLDRAMPLHDVLQRCLQQDSARRPSARDVAAAAHEQLTTMGTESARVLQTVASTLQ
mmetsp:Transcript_105074/g.272096  ORF Transcript_105074/g.272096 Transcript_105074/m.272096 type:complete len:314 (+) Transcript_105074:57-998(+)